MPISGCHDLPLATFNLPSRNNPQNKRQQRPAPSRDVKHPKSPPQGGPALGEDFFSDRERPHAGDAL